MGLALAFAFLVLKAPDVAITQLVVEILCLVILIRATDEIAQYRSTVIDITFDAKPHGPDRTDIVAKNFLDLLALRHA